MKWTDKPSRKSDEKEAEGEIVWDSRLKEWIARSTEYSREFCLSFLGEDEWGKPEQFGNLSKLPRNILWAIVITIEAV